MLENFSVKYIIHGYAFKATQICKYKLLNIQSFIHPFTQYILCTNVKGYCKYCNGEDRYSSQSRQIAIINNPKILVT